ncbi:MAG: transposase [Cyanobacteriota bacterium]|jgi:transposase-like protein
MRHSTPEHWRKVRSTSPLERQSKEIKSRTNVVGLFPNNAVITRLEGSQLLEQQEEWQDIRMGWCPEAEWSPSPSHKSFKWPQLMPP